MITALVAVGASAPTLVRHRCARARPPDLAPLGLRAPPQFHLPHHLRVDVLGVLLLSHVIVHLIHPVLFNES
jgi:hypothetical protein